MYYWEIALPFCIRPTNGKLVQFGVVEQLCLWDQATTSWPAVQLMAQPCKIA